MLEPRYWVSASPSNWNNPANWSLSSGGLGGASVPRLANYAVFDSSGGGSCQMDSCANINGISVSGYDSTIYQNSQEISILRNASFWSGAFQGDSSNIRIGGNFDIGGTCQFISTDQTLSCDSTFTYNPTTGFFNHNNGIVSLDSSGCTLDALDLHTETLQFNTYGYVKKSLYTNKLVLKSGVVGYGSDATIHVVGDLYCAAEYDSWDPQNNLLLLFDGTPLQTIYNEPGCIISNITIDKTSPALDSPVPFGDGRDGPVVICEGDSPLTIRNNFIIQDGTFNSNGVDIRVGI